MKKVVCQRDQEPDIHYSGAPLLSKSSNLLIREILVVTSAYARSPVQTLRGEGGESQDNPTRMKTAIFSLPEIARRFWATGVFLGGNLHDHCRF